MLRRIFGIFVFAELLGMSTSNLAGCKSKGAVSSPANWSAQPASDQAYTPHDPPNVSQSGQSSQSPFRKNRLSKPKPGYPSDDVEIERAIARLNAGIMAYSVPEKMRTSDEGLVTARIGTTEVPTAELTSGLSKEGEAVNTLSTPISTHMKVDLKSEDFDIEQLSTEDQVVNGSTPTTWEWNIKPKRFGTGHVHLSASIELGTARRDYGTVDRDIAIELDNVNAVENFLQGNWKWLVATLGAVIAALIKFYQWSKGRKDATPSKVNEG